MYQMIVIDRACYTLRRKNVLPSLKVPAPYLSTATPKRDNFLKIISNILLYLLMVYILWNYLKYFEICVASGDKDIPHFVWKLMSANMRQWANGDLHLEVCAIASCSLRQSYYTKDSSTTYAAHGHHFTHPRPPASYAHDPRLSENIALAIFLTLFGR